MILILGGTTEGRSCVSVLDEAGSPFYYSTQGSRQQIESRHGIRINGSMNPESMTAFCRQHNIRLLIDAAHPFASQLHQTVAATARQCGIEVIRYERIYPELNEKDIVCHDFEDAVQQLQNNQVRRLLALTGVKTISKLKGYWNQPDANGQLPVCYFRILDREESFRMAADCGFPPERLITYQEQEGEILQLIKTWKPDAVITKESGKTGGFEEKEQAALEAGIPLYVVRKPDLPDQFIRINGPHGLRKAVEKHLPDFFPLRSGFTTGSCATAAAKAALEALLAQSGCGPTITSFTLPDGETLRMATEILSITPQEATASAWKDAGDDPDITDGKEIRATIQFREGPGIKFLPGEGVGTVTLPGLGIPVGEPAINPTPKAMIRREIGQLYQGGINVILSVPEGRNLAQKTFNPRLGIINGISIIGTSGIVRPFSSEAFVGAIRREMEVAKALHTERIVLNSGAKSEQYIKRQYPDLPTQAFVHYGNFIGESLKAAQESGFRQVTLGIMIGKAVKLAAGHLDTHSKHVVLNKEFLTNLAAESGCTAQTIKRIEQLTLARELWELPENECNRLANALIQSCGSHCRKIYTEGELTLTLLDENGNVRATYQSE